MTKELAIAKSEADKLRLASEAEQEKDHLLHQSEVQNIIENKTETCVQKIKRDYWMFILRDINQKISP